MSHFKHLATTYSAIFIGGCALNLTSIVTAANWPFAPYGFLQGAPVVAINLKEDWKQKLSLQGTSILGGVGCLWSPAQVDNWLISLEGYYHELREPHNIAAKERGGFLIGKLSFPHAEGVESFVGAGLGGLYLHKLPREQAANAKWLAFSSIAGLNWHFEKGYYLSLKCLWIKPLGDAVQLKTVRQSTLSFAIGLHWNWI